MGGCASKPKDLDSQQQPLPAETPGSPKKAEGEIVPQEKNDGGETKKDEPLVDLSEPAQEAPKSDEPFTESKTAEAEVAAKPTEDKVEAATEAKEPAKEEKKEVADVVAEKSQVEVASPKSEDKSDAPLVTV